MLKAKVKIDNEVKHFFIPQNWHELTTGSFCRLADLYNSEDEQPSGTEIVAAVLGLPHSDILRVEVSSLDEAVFYNLMFLQKQSGWDAILEAQPKRKFTIGTTKYKLIRDFGRITLGQKEEALQIMNSETPYEEKAYNLLKVFYKDITQSDFDKSSAMEVYPVINFFLRVWYLTSVISSEHLQQTATTNSN